MERRMSFKVKKFERFNDSREKQKILLLEDVLKETEAKRHALL